MLRLRRESLKYTESLHFLSWTHNSVGTAGVLRESPLPVPSVIFGRPVSRPVELPSWTLSWSSAQKELLELQSFNEAGYTKDSMQKVGEQIEEHEYTLAVADAMKKALDAHQKDENSDPASLIESLQQIRKYGPKQRPMYRDEASFMLDIKNRAQFINTANRGTAWKTLFATSDTRSSRKRIYSATGNSLPCANCIIEKGILKVFGAAVDVLEDVSPPCTEAFPLDGPPFAWIRTVLAKRLGLPVSSHEALNPDPDSESDDETSRSLEFDPLFWRIILADQWQGVRLKKGNVVEIPRVGTIPPTISFAMNVGDPKEHIHRIVKELFEVKSAVASSENQAAFKWRSLFTSKKSVGLSPVDGRKGDIVFAIFGCDVPFLVRKAERGYLFLGEW
jgi:hypothetical protein